MILFHGTDSVSIAGAGGGAVTLRSVSLPLSGFRVQLTLCRPGTDFGQGFYTTSSEHQAREWANSRVRALLSRSPPIATNAVVLSFAVDRNWLAQLDALSFVLPSTDFFDLVDDCRLGFPPHGRAGGKRSYDVVYGPVRMGPQKLVLHDCDQVSFHGPSVVGLLPVPYVREVATAPTGLLP